MAHWYVRGMIPQSCSALKVALLSLIRTPDLIASGKCRNSVGSQKRIGFQKWVF